MNYTCTKEEFLEWVDAEGGIEEACRHGFSLDEIGLTPDDEDCLRGVLRAWHKMDADWEDFAGEEF